MVLVRYVNQLTGSNSFDGTTRTGAWATIPYSATQLVPGMIIKIAPGNYTGVTDIPTSGLPGPTIDYTPESWISFEKDTYYAGDVNINGTGIANRAVFSVYGKSFIRFYGLNITIQGTGNSGAICGIEIANSGPFGGPTSQGASFITVDSCSFANIDRDTNFASSFGAPILIYSQASEWVGGTATNHIVVQNCRFSDSNISTPTIFHSDITLAGNVNNFKIYNNTFINNRLANYLVPVTCRGGIEFGGNQLVGSYPDLQRKGVISNNSFYGFAFNGYYAIYPTATQDILITENYVDGYSYGVGLLSERGANPQNTSNHILVIDNLFKDLQFYSLAAGAFEQLADNYSDIYNIWVVNNSTVRTNTSITPNIMLVANLTPGAQHGTLGILGDSFIGRNIIIGEDLLLQSTLPSAANSLLNYNLWASKIANPFIWNNGPATKFPYNVNQDTNGFYQRGQSQIFNQTCLVSDNTAANISNNSMPSWYYKGLFGSYEPASLNVSVELETGDNQIVLGERVGLCSHP